MNIHIDINTDRNAELTKWPSGMRRGVIWYMRTHVWYMCTQVWYMGAHVWYMGTHVWYMCTHVWHMGAHVWYMGTHAWYVSTHVSRHLLPASVGQNSLLPWRSRQMIAPKRL
jgi:hypothetical protein